MKFIDENEVVLQSMCDKAALMMFPLKKKYGYVEGGKTFRDESKFIYDHLLIPTIKECLGGEPEYKMESGWYIVEVYIDNERIVIKILFNICEEIIRR